MTPCDDGNTNTKDDVCTEVSSHGGSEVVCKGTEVIKFPVDVSSLSSSEKEILGGLVKFEQNTYVASILPYCGIRDTFDISSEQDVFALAVNEASIVETLTGEPGETPQYTIDAYSAEWRDKIKEKELSLSPGELPSVTLAQVNDFPGFENFNPATDCSTTEMTSLSGCVPLDATNWLIPIGDGSFRPNYIGVTLAGAPVQSCAAWGLPEISRTFRELEGEKSYTVKVTILGLDKAPDNLFKGDCANEDPVDDEKVRVRCGGGWLEVSQTGISEAAVVATLQCTSTATGQITVEVDQQYRFYRIGTGEYNFIPPGKLYLPDTEATGYNPSVVDGTSPPHCNMATNKMVVGGVETADPCEFGVAGTQSGLAVSLIEITKNAELEDSIGDLTADIGENVVAYATGEDHAASCSGVNVESSGTRDVPIISDVAEVAVEDLRTFAASVQKATSSNTKTLQKKLGEEFKKLDAVEVNAIEDRKSKLKTKVAYAQVPVYVKEQTKRTPPARIVTVTAINKGYEADISEVQPRKKVAFIRDDLYKTKGCSTPVQEIQLQKSPFFQPKDALPVTFMEKEATKLYKDYVPNEEFASVSQKIQPTITAAAAAVRNTYVCPCDADLDAIDKQNQLFGVNTRNEFRASTSCIEIEAEGSSREVDAADGEGISDLDIALITWGGILGATVIYFSVKFAIYGGDFTTYALLGNDGWK